MEGLGTPKDHASSKPGEIRIRYSYISLILTKSHDPPKHSSATSSRHCQRRTPCTAAPGDSAAARDTPEGGRQGIRPPKTCLKSNPSVPV